MLHCRKTCFWYYFFCYLITLFRLSNWSLHLSCLVRNGFENGSQLENDSFTNIHAYTPHTCISFFHHSFRLQNYIFTLTFLVLYYLLSPFYLSFFLSLSYLQYLFLYQHFFCFNLRISAYQLFFFSDFLYLGFSLLYSFWYFYGFANHFYHLISRILLWIFNVNYFVWFR